MKYEGVTEVEWAQLATWFDSEGTLSFSKWARPSVKSRRRTPMYRPLTCVSNSDDRVFVWLKARFGGYVNTERPQTETRKTSRVWMAPAGDALVEMLRRVIPHLILKQAQAELVIKFYTEALWRKGGHGRCMPEEEIQRREHLYQCTKQLNRKGPPCAV